MIFHEKFNGQNILSILFFYLFLSSFSSAANNYSIYLARHAEELNSPKKTELTACGKFRAKQLSNLLSQTNITQIYSTYEQHFMQTARPLANQRNIAIKNYNFKYLEQLSLKLQQQKTNTLIIGDSNTTQKLTSLLTEKVITPISEQDYQTLYQIQYFDKQVTLTIFQQPLLCK